MPRANFLKYHSKIIFRVFIFVWLFIWLIFSVEWNKKMEHPLTGYLNSYADSENKRHILGAELYNFLIFCKVNIPQDASYDYYSATQDKKDNEALVYARYFLYPLRRIVSDPDYKIYYRSDPLNESGYKLFKTFRDFGVILKKEQ